MVTLICVACHVSRSTHTHRYTSIERSVLRNRLTWSRRLGCPWSAIGKLVVSLSYPSAEAPEPAAWVLRVGGESAALRTRRAARGSGTPSSARRQSSSASKGGAARPRTGAGVRVGGRRLNSALRLQPPLETLPGAQKSRPADGPGSCDPVNLTQKMHRSRHRQ